MQEVKEYIIWNEGKNACSNYKELLKYEAITGCSHSSVIRTDDITGIVIALQNEVDVDIDYIECYSDEQTLTVLKEQLRQAKYIIEASENSEAIALLTTMEIMGL